MAQFSPSGRIGVASLVSLACIGLLAGALLGLGVYYVSLAVYFILLFPLLWGVVLGAIVAYGVKVVKCRNPLLAVLVALLSATLTYGTYHEMRNRDVRQKIKNLMAESMAKQSPGPTEPSVDAAYAQWLARETGFSDFRGEFIYRAKAGVSVSHGGGSSRDRGLQITGVGMYIYWAIELLVIAVCASLIPAARARQVFCEGCQEWYTKVQLVKLAPGKVPAAVEALTRRDFAAFQACVSYPGGGYVSLEKCPACQTAPLNVVLEAAVKDRRGRESRRAVYQDLFSREEANGLISSVRPPEKPPGAAPT